MELSKTKKPPIRYTIGEPTIEVREAMPGSDEKEFVVKGYAALYDVPSTDISAFTEIIRPGAFDDVVKTADVRCLWNHKKELVLARHKPGRENNTLKIWSDEKGLGYEFVLGKSQTIVREALERGDVDGHSFAFNLTIDDQIWTEEKHTDEAGNVTWTVKREILKVGELYEITLSTFPAYETQIEYELRDYETWSKENGRMKEDESTEDKAFEIQQRREYIRLLETS